jgi:hypothetical protein
MIEQHTSKLSSRIAPAILPFAAPPDSLRNPMAKAVLGKGLGALIKTHVVSPSPLLKMASACKT